MTHPPTPATTPLDANALVKATERALSFIRPKYVAEAATGPIIRAYLSELPSASASLDDGKLWSLTRSTIRSAERAEDESREHYSARLDSIAARIVKDILSALPVPPVATALDEKGLPCAWCNGLPGHFDWCTNPALAASPNEPVVSATADHPAIYKDGHRLVAGNRATLPSAPVARSGEGPSEQFERVAEAFYKCTGMLAPGKDDAIGLHPYEDRIEAWRIFIAGRNTAAHPISPALVGDEATKAFGIGGQYGLCNDCGGETHGYSTTHCEKCFRAQSAPRLAEVEARLQEFELAVRNDESRNNRTTEYPDKYRAALLALLGPAGGVANEDLRPEVLAFAWQMELKLRKHDAKRGRSWQSESVEWLMNRAAEEWLELQAAKRRMLGDAWPIGRPEFVSEAADVANFLWMAAVNAGTMSEVLPRAALSGAVPANGAGETK